MNELLQGYMKEKQELINSELVSMIKRLKVEPTLKSSMLYSMEAGGKRLRPILMLAVYEAFGGKGKDILQAACALEMVHTYSLIHDDLPAMDNDDFRRGIPTNHKKFNEATAILAGDALLTYSFEVISSMAAKTAEVKIRLISMLAEAAGPEGMVGGQQMDMEAENRVTSLKELETIHELKTGKLLEFAVNAGAELAGANEEQQKSLKEFARLLGIVFQVQDDILDVSGDPDKLGKPVGSDQSNFKSTYPGHLGLNGAIEKRNEYCETAKSLLKKAKIDAPYLSMITDYLAYRDF